MEDEIIYYSGGGALGDNIFILPIFNNEQNIGKTVVFNDGNPDYARNLIPFVFNEKANIKYQSINFNTIDNWNSSEHKCIQVMKHFGYYGSYSCIPKMTLTSRKNVIDKITGFLENIKNPIVFHPHCRAWQLPGASLDRCFPEEFSLLSIQILIDSGFTPVMFPIGRLFYKNPRFDNIHYFSGLDIEELSYAYSLIGKYFGSQSGGADLMVAIGGKSIILLPDNQQFIDTYCWDQIFLNETVPSLTKTFTFKNQEQALNSLNFYD